MERDTASLVTGKKKGWEGEMETAERKKNDRSRNENAVDREMVDGRTDGWMGE